MAERASVLAPCPSMTLCISDTNFTLTALAVPVLPETGWIRATALPASSIRGQQSMSSGT